MTAKLENFIVPNGNFKLDVVISQDDKNTVALDEHFLVWRESLCEFPSLIDPTEEDYLFLSNGSLKIIVFEGELETALPFSEYCLLEDASFTNAF